VNLFLNFSAISLNLSQFLNLDLTWYNNDLLTNISYLLANSFQLFLATASLYLSATHLAILSFAELPSFDLVVTGTQAPIILCSDVSTSIALSEKSSIWGNLYASLSPTYNTDLASAIKVAYDLNNIRRNETTNYIHLLWLKLWVSSFYYHDKQEQKYRFFQMLKIIERISQHEMGVINNLFNVLIDCKIDEDLILLLYEKIPTNINYRTLYTNFIRKVKKNIYI